MQRYLKNLWWADQNWPHMDFFIRCSASIRLAACWNLSRAHTHWNRQNSKIRSDNCNHKIREPCATKPLLQGYVYVLTRRTDLLYILMYCWVRGTSSILKVTPVKLNCLAMYIPLNFISIATISMAPTPLKWNRWMHFKKNRKGTKFPLNKMSVHRVVMPGCVMYKFRNKPALNSLDEVAKLSEGSFMSPDAQPVHVSHVSGFRGS